MSTYPEDLYAAAKAVLPNAYARYSHFPVAASIRTKSGQIYAGVNVENASFSLTCCAEQNAVSTMIAQGNNSITQTLILTQGPLLCPPCGACRQVLNEFASPDCEVHLCTLTGDHKQFYFTELLPATFGSDHLKTDGA